MHRVDDRLEKFLRGGDKQNGQLLQTCIPSRVAKVAGQDRILAFTCSTEGVKRDGNMLRMDGWELENYKKTGAPVLWCHDLKGVALGNALNLRVDRIGEKKALCCEMRFAPEEVRNEFADLVYRSYASGIMRAVSVHWIPIEWKQRVDEKGQHSGWDFMRQEMVEISLCPVPYDPDAVMRAVQTGQMSGEEAGKLAWRMGGVEGRPLPITVRVEVEVPQSSDEQDSAAADSAPDPEQHPDDTTAGASERGAVKLGSQGSWPKAPEGAAWDAARAVAGLRQAHGGSKDKMDWSAYAQGFGWFDSDNKESFGSYKLPHHVVQGGRMAQHWRGTAAAMGALLGARGGTSIPADDKRSVFSHLSGHYKAYEKTPPPFRAFSSVEELDRALEAGEWVCDEETAGYLRGALTENEEEQTDFADATGLMRAAAMEVQSVLCSKQRFKSADAAREWCADHDFKTSKLDETDQYYRFRQFEPGSCQDGTARTVTMTRGVKSVMCKRKSQQAADAETLGSQARGELGDALSNDQEAKLYDAFRNYQRASDKLVRLCYGMKAGEVDNGGRCEQMLKEFSAIVSPYLTEIADNPSKNQYSFEAAMSRASAAGHTASSQPPEATQPESEDDPRALAFLRSLERLSGETGQSPGGVPDLERAEQAHARIKRMLNEWNGAEQ